MIKFYAEIYNISGEPSFEGLKSVIATHAGLYSVNESRYFSEFVDFRNADQSPVLFWEFDYNFRKDDTLYFSFPWNSGTEIRNLKIFCNDISTTHNDGGRTVFIAKNILFSEKENPKFILPKNFHFEKDWLIASQEELDEYQNFLNTNNLSPANRFNEKIKISLNTEKGSPGLLKIELGSK